MVQEVNGIPNQALLITEGVKYFAKLRCPLQPVVPFFSLLKFHAKVNLIRY